MKVRIRKGILECDKGDGKYVPQLCLRKMDLETDTFRGGPMCSVGCPLLDAPINDGKTTKAGKLRLKQMHTITGCEFMMNSTVPIEFVDDSGITIKGDQVSLIIDRKIDA